MGGAVPTFKAGHHWNVAMMLRRQAIAAPDGDTEMTNTAAWIKKLEGLSEQPLLRAAQIALAALDEIITSDQLDDDTPAVAAYETLQSAIAGAEKEAA